MDKKQFTDEEIQRAHQIYATQGGKAKAAKMTPEERSEMARKMAAARWAKSGAEKMINAASK